MAQTTQISLASPCSVPFIPGSTVYSTATSNTVTAQIILAAQPTTFATEYAAPAHWARDITIGTLDDSATISVPDDPVDTVANMEPNPTATDISPTSTPDTAPSAFNDPPLGGDLDKITDKICKEKCTPGSDFEYSIWTNSGTIHNGTHISTNHTEIYCDGKCIAHLRTIITSFDTTNSVDAVPTTSVFTTVAAAASAAATSAVAAIAGSVNRLLN